MKINVENVVVSAKLDREIDLNNLAVVLEGAVYEPEQFPAVVYRLAEFRATSLIFGSGKIVCAGARSPADAQKAIIRIMERVRETGVELHAEPKIKIRNMVASGDLGSELDLERISILLPNCEYEPEQFPGLIHRMSEPTVVLLIFRSGRVICAGAKKLDEIKEAINKVYGELKDIGEIS